jgi:hypothetical protein
MSPVQRESLRKQARLSPRDHLAKLSSSKPVEIVRSHSWILRIVNPGPMGLPHRREYTQRQTGRMAMSRLLVALGALVAGALLVPGEAAAQYRPGFGSRGGGGAMIRPPVGGGFGGGGFRGRIAGAPGGIGGFRGGAIGLRPGLRGGPGIRPGFGYRPAAIVRPGFGGYGWRAPGYYGRVSGIYRPYYRGYYGRGWRYPYYGGWGWDDGWGWGAAGLVTGTLIGAAAASTYPVYTTPVPPPIGGYCATPVRTCDLIDPAPVGIGCSCRTAGGRARGTVVMGP